MTRNRPSVIPVGVVVSGSIEGEGDLIVLGRVEGPIRLAGSIAIESGGVVQGHIHARTIRIGGILKGNAYGDDVVSLTESARLVGDVTAPRVKIVRGAQFSGRVHMGEVDAPQLDGYESHLHTFTGLPAPLPSRSTRVFDVRGDGLPTALGVPSPPTLVGGFQVPESSVPPVSVPVIPVPAIPASTIPAPTLPAPPEFPMDELPLDLAATEPAIQLKERRMVEPEGSARPTLIGALIPSLTQSRASSAAKPVPPTVTSEMLKSASVKSGPVESGQVKSAPRKRRRGPPPSRMPAFGRLRATRKDS